MVGIVMQKKAVKKQGRQGDVFLTRVKELPANVVPKDQILAYGEATGHKHMLCGAEVYIDQATDTQYAVLKQETVLKHDEHGAIKFAPGVYKVAIQREFDLVEGVRRVAD